MRKWIINVDTLTEIENNLQIKPREISWKNRMLQIERVTCNIFVVEM